MHVVIGKAGRNRWKGKRPTVRGSVMNPMITRMEEEKVVPLLVWLILRHLWGLPALGVKTRKRKNRTNV